MSRTSFYVRSTILMLVVFGVLCAIAFSVCHIYLSLTSYQTMANWHASQATEIQEGNLLGAVTKIQRMKQSSEYLQGVLLKNFALGRQGNLIQFGKEIDESQINPNIHEVTTINSGFFEQYVMMPIPKTPDTILIFSIKSILLRNLFLGLSLALFLLFAFFQLILPRKNGHEIYAAVNCCSS